MARERKQWEAYEERLVQQLRELQQNIASAGLPSGVRRQNMTQNQGEAVKQSQVLHQEGDVKVPKGIVTGEHHDETSYQSNVGFECQSQFPLRNVQLFGSEYQYAQAVGEVQPTQPPGEEAGITRDYRQSSQVETVHGPMDSILPVCNQSVTSALLAQQLPSLPKFSGEMNDGDMEIGLSNLK